MSIGVCEFFWSFQNISDRVSSHGKRFAADGKSAAESVGGSDNFVGIQYVFRVKRLFDTAHDLDLRRTVLLRHKGFLCVPYSVFARNESAQFITLAVHPIEGDREFFLEFVLRKIVAADINVKVSVARVSEARNTDRKLLGSCGYI